MDRNDGRAQRRSFGVAPWLVAALAGAAGAAPQAPLTATLVKDIRPGYELLPIGSFPERVGEGPAFALFSAHVQNQLAKPFATDGASGVTPLLPGELASVPFGFGYRAAAIGNELVFTARGGMAEGFELWRTDGTAAGTALVVDLAPGAASSQPFAHVAFQGAAYFIAFSGGGIFLLRTDGTAAGTQVLADVEQLAGPITIPSQLDLFVAGDRLWLWTGTQGSALIATDGTAGGTHVAATLPGAIFPRQHGRGVGVGQRVLFSTSAGIGFAAIRSTNGLPGGSETLATIPVNSTLPAPAWIVEAGGKAMFASQPSPSSGSPVLYASDGTAAGTAVVTQFLMMTASAAAVANGVVFGANASHAFGVEPYFSDGTAAGTGLLADLAPGVASSVPTFVGAWNGRTFFKASTPATGLELYSTDGTTAGTALALDLAPGAASTVFPSDSAYFPAPQGFVFRVDSSAGQEPFVSDGTPAGTGILANIGPEMLADSHIEEVVRFGDRIAFTADDGVHGRELWTSDGTAAGTAMVVDLAPGPASSDPRELVVLGGKLCFAANDPSHPIDREPWTSDGTAAGTHRLKDVNATPVAGGSTNTSVPEQFTIAGDALYFVAHDGVHGFELWKSDGTEAGTALARDLYEEPSPGSATLKPLILDAAGDRVFLLWQRKGLAAPQGTGLEPCISDGTLAGTTVIADLAPGPANAAIAEARVAGDRLLFALATTSLGNELWQSDGTAAGTTPVVDLVAGTGSAWPAQFAVLGDRLLFTAVEGASGQRALWVSDGTAAGTQKLLAQAQVSEQLLPVFAESAAVAYFRLGLATGPKQLFRCDGTAAGTAPVYSYALDLPVPNDLVAFESTGAGGRLLFSATSPGSGTELWLATGSAGAAFPLTDSNPGSADSTPASVARAGNLLFFVADDGVTGRELHAVPFAATGTFDAATYGKACSAAPAAPALGASGTPALGQQATLSLTGAAPGASAILLWSATKGELPLPGECALQLAAPGFLFAASADFAGGIALPFVVPNLPGLAGFVANFQFAVGEAGGPYLGSFGFTAGLELIIGP